MGSGGVERLVGPADTMGVDPRSWLRERRGGF